MLIRKKLMTIATIVLVVLLLVACGNVDSSGEESISKTDEEMMDDDVSTGDTIDYEDAERIYTFSCASCHGNDLAGQGPFPALTNIGSKLSEEEIKTIIIEGIGTMPPGRVTPDEADTVAKWLSETQSQKN